LSQCNLVSFKYIFSCTPNSITQICILSLHDALPIFDPQLPPLPANQPALHSDHPPCIGADSGGHLYLCPGSPGLLVAGPVGTATQPLRQDRPFHAGSGPDPGCPGDSVAGPLCQPPGHVCLSLPVCRDDGQRGL